MRQGAGSISLAEVHLRTARGDQKKKVGSHAHLHLLSLPLAHGLMRNRQQVEVLEVDGVPHRALAGAHGCRGQLRTQGPQHVECRHNRPALKQIRMVAHLP